MIAGAPFAASGGDRETMQKGRKSAGAGHASLGLQGNQHSLNQGLVEAFRNHPRLVNLQADAVAVEWQLNRIALLLSPMLARGKLAA